MLLYTVKGTHGTGLKHGNLATFVTKLELVSGRGEVKYTLIQQWECMHIIILTVFLTSSTNRLMSQDHKIIHILNIEQYLWLLTNCCGILHMNIFLIRCCVVINGILVAYYPYIWYRYMESLFAGLFNLGSALSVVRFCGRYHRPLLPRCTYRD